MLAAWSLIVICAVLPAADPVTPADPSDPVVVDPQPAPPPPPVDPVEPVAPTPPTPTTPPTPPTTTPKKTTTKAPPPDRLARATPAAMGVGAAAGGCVGAIVPTVLAPVFPLTLCAVPFTAVGGAVAGTAIVSGTQPGEYDLMPMYIASGVSIVGAGLVGAGIGAGLFAISCGLGTGGGGGGIGSGCGFVVPAGAAIGGLLGSGVVGPIVAGVSVALIAAQPAP